MESKESEMVLVYGTEWCGQSKRARSVLDEYNIPYKFIDVDTDEKASEFVKKHNNGYRSVPTIIFPDGTSLTEPRRDDLIAKLGLN